MRREEAVEEGLEHRHVAHLGRDVRHLCGWFLLVVCKVVQCGRVSGLLLKGSRGRQAGGRAVAGCRESTHHDRVVVRPREGQPLEAERDVAAVLQPEQPDGEGGEEPGGRDVCAGVVCVFGG